MVFRSASSWPLVGQPLEVGQYVAAPQEDVFYRARVMALAPNSNGKANKRSSTLFVIMLNFRILLGVSFAQVLYIDYGNTGE